MKSKLSNLTIKTLAGTILFESCTDGNYLNYSVEEINEFLSGNLKDCNNVALPINVKFSDEQCEYLLFLQTLSHEILLNPTTARTFIENPSEYIKSKGFRKNNINIDSKLTKIILALANTDICNAIQSGNVSLYLELLEKEGLLDRISITELDQFKERSFSIKYNLNDNQKSQIPTSMSAVAFAVAVLVGAVAVVWAVAVEHFVAANAVGAVTSVAWKVAAVTSGKKLTTHLDALLATNTMKVWNLKSQDPQLAYMVADEFTSLTVESLMKYFRTNMPEIYTQIDLSILRNAIIVNLQNMPYEE